MVYTFLIHYICTFIYLKDPATIYEAVAALNTSMGNKGRIVDKAEALKSGINNNI